MGLIDSLRQKWRDINAKWAEEALEYAQRDLNAAKEWRRLEPFGVTRKLPDATPATDKEKFIKQRQDRLDVAERRYRSYFPESQEIPDLTLDKLTPSS